MMTWSEWIDGGERVALTPAEGAPARLFVREAGRRDDPPLLMLHGFPTHSFDWARMLAHLPGRRVIMPDLLGFGGSDKPKERYSFPRQAALVEALLAARGVDGDVTIVAHDYSVTLLQELLAREAEGRLPFRIPRAVMLNGGVYGALHRPVLTQRLLLLPWIGPVVASGLTGDRLYDGLNRIAGPDLQWSVEDAHAHFEGISASGGLKRLPASLHYIADRRRFGARWQEAMEAAAPKLSLLWGEADPVSGAHMLERVRERAPAARIVSFADIGHYPHWEAPERIGPALARLLEL